MKSVLSLLFILCLYLPRVDACAVCFSGNSANLLAYHLTTILLTLMPLIFIGGVIYWIRKTVQKAKALE